MKKVLIFRGGWTGHEPVQTSEIVAAELLRRGTLADIVDNQELLAQEGFISGYDAIIPVWTMGELLPEAGKKIFAAVSAGVGIAGWHGGMCDAFRTNTEWQFMTGGQWVAHPGNIIDYEVNIVGNDPLVAGLKDFRMHSEQYYMHVDPGNEVLATTRFDGSRCAWIKDTVMPVVWKRHYGKGRVFYSSLGHTAADFQVPEVLEIIIRGILWAKGV